MHAYERWKDNYRKVFGCTTVGVCWCNVCCNLETAWEEAMQAAKFSIDGVRHPVNVRREAARAVKGGD